jgi:hypothetical protein
MARRSQWGAERLTECSRTANKMEQTGNIKMVNIPVLQFYLQHSLFRTVVVP